MILQLRHIFLTEAATFMIFSLTLTLVFTWRWLTAHLHDHYALYGERTGVRSARKHIGWAVSGLPGGADFRDTMNRLETCEAQVRALTGFFDQLADVYRLLPAANDVMAEMAA